MRYWLLDNHVKFASLFCAVVGYFAVAMVSLMPAAYRPDVGIFSDKLEHALAYLLLALLSLIATRQIISPRWVGLALLAYAAILEFGQLLTPDRTASVTDFAASAAGAITGIWIMTLIVGRLERQRNLIDAARERT